MYEYRIKKLLRVHDGDTIFVDTDMGRKMIMEEDGVRFYGLNCPEIGDKDPALRKRAEAAMAFVKERLSVENVQIKMQTKKPRPDDKYGRWLGIIYYRTTPAKKKDADNWDGVIGWKCLNEELLAAGHAKPYTGEGVKPV